MGNNVVKYDAIIIGTGQSGKPLATSLASAGWNTAIIEEKYVGGTCVNYGCTPTKTMIASARIAYLAKRASDYGINIPSVSINLKKVRERKDAIVNSFRQGGKNELEKTENVNLIFGKAKFKNEKEIDLLNPQFDNFSHNNYLNTYL